MSAVLDYISTGISDTYNETIDYWSKDGSMSDAIETLAWSATNVSTVADATKKGIEKSTEELKTAVSKDASFLGSYALKVGVGLLAAYFAFTYAKSYAARKGKKNAS